jgi:hypothetical protein
VKGDRLRFTSVVPENILLIPTNIESECCEVHYDYLVSRINYNSKIIKLRPYSKVGVSTLVVYAVGTETKWIALHCCTHDLARALFPATPVISSLFGSCIIQLILRDRRYAKWGINGSKSSSLSDTFSSTLITDGRKHRFHYKSVSGETLSRAERKLPL